MSTVKDTIAGLTTVGANLTLAQRQLMATIPPGILSQPVITPPPPIVTVTIDPSITDLAKLPWATNTIYVPPDARAYNWTGTTNVTADNCELRLNGNPVTVLLSPNSGSCVYVTGNNVKIGGFTVPAAPRQTTLIRCAGLAPTIHDIRIDVTIEQGVQLDQAHGATVTNVVSTVQTGSRLIDNNGSDKCIIGPGNATAGSLGEDDIRFNPWNDGHNPPHRPIGGHVFGNKLGMVKQGGKQGCCFSCREADGVEFGPNNECFAWNRFGENVQDSVTCNDVYVHDNILHPDPNGINLLTFYSATAKVERNTFPGLNASQRCISTVAMSKVTTDGNVKTVPTGIKAKPLMIDHGKENDGTNTTTIVIAP